MIMTDKTSAIAEKYEELRKIDVHKLGIVEKKKTGFKDLDYISWANALDLLKTHDPNTTFTYDTDKEKFYPDGTMMVQVTLHALGTVQTEIMPVIANGNKAIQNPNSHQINTAYKRCLAKCISTTTGLGISLYAGDLGINEEEDQKKSVIPDKTTFTLTVKQKSTMYKSSQDFTDAYMKVIEQIMEYDAKDSSKLAKIKEIHGEHADVINRLEKEHRAHISKKIGGIYVQLESKS